jgi:PcfJ-like protein
MSRGPDNPDFAYWIALNVLKVGNRIGPVLHFLSDMDDWVMEAKRKKPRCITRPFSPDMSVNTVRMENKLWHEAIAKCKAAKSKYKIPAPWYPAGQVNGYQIVPLDSTEELWKEGRAMYHCAGAYDYRVASRSVRLADAESLASPTPFSADVLKAAREQKLVVGEPRPSASLLVKFWLLEFYFLNAPSVRDALLWSKAASAFLS